MKKGLEYKVTLMLKIFSVDLKRYRESEAKNRAVRENDFETAIIHREREKKLFDEYFTLCEEADSMFNSEQGAQGSDTTKAK